MVSLFFLIVLIGKIGILLICFFISLAVQMFLIARFVKMQHTGKIHGSLCNYECFSLICT
jgi:hypothetical protein